MSLFEFLMLICFGAAWPFSLYRSWVSGTTAGKSLPFMIVIAAGYLFGVLHKIFFNYDWIIFLYIINGLMVSADIAIYFRNRKKEGNQSRG